MCGSKCPLSWSGLKLEGATEGQTKVHFTFTRIDVGEMELVAEKLVGMNGWIVRENLFSFFNELKKGEFADNGNVNVWERIAGLYKGEST